VVNFSHEEIELPKATVLGVAEETSASLVAAIYDEEAPGRNDRAKTRSGVNTVIDIMGCTSRFCCKNNDRVATARKGAATSTEDVATSVCCIDAAVQTETGDKEDAEYEVEKKLDMRMRREYLLKWEGYPNEDNSWVNADHLSCPYLVKEYEERLDTGRSSTARQAGGGQ
jgi:hypothetical protein